MGEVGPVGLVGEQVEVAGGNPTKQQPYELHVAAGRSRIPGGPYTGATTKQGTLAEGAR